MKTAERTFRVTIRGRFHELSDEASAYLRRARVEHDIFESAYTPEGSLTYDDRIDFFNLRYECRAGDQDCRGGRVPRGGRTVPPHDAVRVPRPARERRRPDGDVG